MKLLQRSVTANTNNGKLTKLSTKPKYSNSDVLDLLLSITELKGQPIYAVETENDSCEFNIGEKTYSIYGNNSQNLL
ncbi:MAG: hypothetical protein J5659_02455 [Clostridia bacterium]|nr:hypothetical protein [Clostridia bacterium]